MAQTGTGKTAAFALPILQKLGKPQQPVAARSAHALILAPTRELAIQIGDSFATYGRHTGLRHTVILGGVGQPQQVKAMARGVDILIATPGRLLDLVQQKHVRLNEVKHFVLDEADRMLDMGFIRDVRKIVAMLPKKRQSLLFSATMPTDVAKLAAEMLHDPLRVEVTPEAVTVDLVDQRVHFVETAQKRALLTDLLRDPGLARVIVFTRTKHHANRVSEHLERAGVVQRCAARQQVAECAAAGAGTLPLRPCARAGGDRHRGARHRCGWRHARDQLRTAATSRRAMFTASAVRRGPEIPASRLPSAISPSVSFLRDIERLTRRPLTVIGDSDPRPLDTPQAKA